MTRLDRLRQYLEEANRDPENNKLYIEDLKVSIKDAERFENPQLEKGFVG